MSKPTYNSLLVEFLKAMDQEKADQLAWLRTVKEIKDGLVIDAYRAGFEQGVARARAYLVLHGQIKGAEDEA
jgi:hypothetical protein